MYVYRLTPHISNALCASWVLRAPSTKQCLIEPDHRLPIFRDDTHPIGRPILRRRYHKAGLTSLISTIPSGIASPGFLFLYSGFNMGPQPSMMDVVPSDTEVSLTSTRSSQIENHSIVSPEFYQPSSSPSPLRHHSTELEIPTAVGIHFQLVVLSLHWYFTEPSGELSSTSSPTRQYGSLRLGHHLSKLYRDSTAGTCMLPKVDYRLPKLRSPDYFENNGSHESSFD